MTIFAGSRYVNQTVIRVQDAERDATFPAVYRGPTRPTARFLHYTVVTGDRYDLLAAKYYGNPNLWWVIADANPEILYPIPLPIGAIIRIPQQP